MKKVGIWWNSRDIELMEVNGKVYALYGWCGDAYTACWECSGEHLMDASEEEYILEPVYRYQVENIDLDEIDEGSDEWDRATEIVDYDVTEK